MAKKKFKIMILDDDKALVRVLEAHLTEYETVGMTDANQAIESAHNAFLSWRDTPFPPPPARWWGSAKAR